VVLVLAMAGAVVVVVLQEKMLVQTVAGKGDGRDAEAREGVLEPVEAREAARVAPRFAVLRASCVRS
jgi:hypothetical protein